MDKTGTIAKLKSERHDLMFKHAGATDHNRKCALSFQINRLNEELYQLTGDEVYLKVTDKWKRNKA